MVVFTCNNCGDSLKKNQILKHALQSRGCSSFSCMDCCKDFTLQSYKTHTSCMSEAQRYQGALYEGPEDGESKGSRKQKQWIEQVKQSIDSAKHLSPRVSALLSAVADYPNVPRKQKKFENFVYNSLKERNPKIIQQVWEAFSGQSKTNKLENDEISSKQSNVTLEIEEEKLSEREENEIDLPEEEESKKLKVKKKKRKKDLESENVEIQTLYSEESPLPDSTTGGEEIPIKIKKSKRKRIEIEIEIENVEKKVKTEDSEVKHKKKKSKHKQKHHEC
eukprot:TRINITY_DN9957_c0_g1_i1.p1 TRINITY_DN9957_c0_g1~~TRINITY_DN9957_c0_g1_i1.p1  ORF type:complete len:277 (+),score=64.08 TRINITY_DN9957_c0_g1_i1:250-1080(+)